MYQNSDFLEMEAHFPWNSITPVYTPKMNHNSSANGSKRNHDLTSDQLVFCKEAFKQTMLHHEMIFKNQIVDLHRLYERQRELMGITGNELDKHNMGTKASKHTTFSSQTSVVCTQKMFNIPACSPFSGAKNIQSPSCLVQKRSKEACSYPVQTEGHSGEHEILKSKCKKSQKNLDRLLPPDIIYIDCEEEEFVEEGKVSEAAKVSNYPKKTPEVVCNYATNGLDSVSKFASSAASLQYGLVDFSYRYKPEEVKAPPPDSSWGPTAIEAYSSIFVQGTKSKQDWLSSYDYNAGKTGSSFNNLPCRFYADNLSLPSNLLHKKLKQHEPLCSLRNYQSSSGERAMVDDQNLFQNSVSKGDDQSGPSEILMCTSSLHVPRDDMEKSGSSCFAGLRKSIHDLVRAPIVNTSVPISNNCNSSTLRTGLEEESSQLNKHLRSSTKQDGSVIGSSFSNLELNKGAQPPSTGCDNLIRDGLVPERHVMCRSLQDSANVNAQMDIDLNAIPLNCSLDAPISKSFQTLGEKHEGSNGRSPLHRPKVDYYGKTDEGCDNHAEVSDSQRAHGFPTSGTPNLSGDHCHHVSSSNHHQNTVQDVKDCKTAVPLDLNVHYDLVHIKEAELTAEEHGNKSKSKEEGSFGVHIDLNSSMNDIEFGVQIDLNASINEYELSVLSSPSTPASPENKECSPPRGASTDRDQVDTPEPMSGLEAPENKESLPSTGEAEEDHIDRPFPLPVQEISVKQKVCAQPSESDEYVEGPFALSGQGGLQNKFPFQPMESDENQIESPSLLSNMENKDCSQPIDSDENQFETHLPSGLDDMEFMDCSRPMDCGENQILTPLPLSGLDNLETIECSQPMDFTEKQIGAPQLSQHDEVCLEELMFRTAAECLVSISSSECHAYSVRTKDEPTKASSNPLKWLAGLASSVLGSLENKVGFDDHQVVLPDGMDYFEAMTLMLPQTKVEENCCYRGTNYKEVMVAASSQSQPKRGRPKKGMQTMKNFQKEVLPGLESLSRCEVSEDLQIIGTLVEASADCFETRSVRHAAKFGLTRGRRKCTISASSVKENTVASPLNRLGVRQQREKRSLFDWSKVTRRPRGQRTLGSKV